MKIDDAEGFDSKMLALTVGGTQAYVMLELFAAMVKPGQAVLITDPLSAVGQALVHGVVEHGDGTPSSVEEAKVDEKLPEYKRATARDKRYGNPYGSHELGGGIRKDRRADHEAKRSVKEHHQK